jgi:hypothetical protein
MMVMNLASPSERFEGFRPAHCRRKAYSLPQGIVPHQSNAPQAAATAAAVPFVFIVIVVAVVVVVSLAVAAPFFS